MFSNLSSSSISLATVTPSLVMRGTPNDLSSTTFRPLGPRVTFTALFRMSAPRTILPRASTENLTSLAVISFSDGQRDKRYFRGQFFSQPPQLYNGNIRGGKSLNGELID